MDLKQLRKYLVKYIYDIKNHELPEKYKKATTIYKKMEQFINDYTIQNPNEVFLLEGHIEDIQKKSLQTGGKLFTPEFVTKMNELSLIFSSYKKIDLSQVSSNMTDLDIKLDELLAEIESLNPEDYKSFTTVVNVNKIANSLELIKIRLTSMGKNIKVEKSKTEINVPIKEFIPKEQLIDKTYLEKVIDKLMDHLKNMSTGSVNFEENNKEKIENFIKLIESETNKINILLSIISNVLEEIKAYITDLNDLLLYVYDNTEIKIEVNFKGKYSEKIKNNFLISKSSTNDMLSKINMIANVIKDDSVLYTDSLKINDIYNPNFENLKDVIQKGGFTMDDLEEKLSIFKDLVVKYFFTVDEYKKQLKKFNILQLQSTTHTFFLTLIITNQLFTPDYIIFNYVNKGMLTFYYRIVKNILKNIDDELGDNNKDEILYFKKYHYFTLKKLNNFLGELIIKTKSSEVINVLECTGLTSDRFLLLNYFKPLLESYKIKYQNKITIYSRINDIGNNSTQLATNKKFFESDQNNTSLMTVVSNRCTMLSTEPNQLYNFTEVFDTENFPENGDISKYMTLDTQLANKKGVAIMTYGYSGTGKTYTLFGNNELKKKGILQSTLDNIGGLQEVKFRLFELYGYGIPYEHYWKTVTDEPRIDNIYHEIYSYNIGVNPEGLYLSSIGQEGVLKKTVTYPAPSIKDFIEDNSKYTLINSQIVSDVFANFDQFMNEVERERECKNEKGELLTDKTSKMKRRIRDTPNNIVSSRSVLIYDFQLKIGGKYVPFLIVDLPGREEIVQTYIDPFFEKDTIKEILNYGWFDGKYNSSNPLFKQKLLEIKFLVATMALNPIAVPILGPDIIFDYINSDEFGQINRKIIIETKIQLEFDVRDSESGKIVTKIGNYSLFEEVINMKEWPLSIFFEYSQQSYKIKFDPKTTDQTHIKNMAGKNKYGEYTGFKYSKTDDYQYKALLGIHVINRLILLNRFDLLYDIFNRIVKEKINDVLESGIDKLVSSKNPVYTADKMLERLKNDNFKGEIINKLPKTKQGTLEDLKHIVNYDYYLTPLEGIYINENIAGIIKYLASKLIVDINDLAQVKVEIQDPNNKFKYRQKLARIWLTSNGQNEEKEIEEIAHFFNIDKEQIPNRLINEFNNKISINYDGMEKEYNKLITSYESHKIFSFTKPIITNILDTYIDPNKATEEKIIIEDFKVFYLFGNYEDNSLGQLKCYHQNTLLNNTKNFIDVIVKNS